MRRMAVFDVIVSNADARAPTSSPCPVVTSTASTTA